MQLTAEQQQILDGAKGETMAKVMKTMVMYGDAFEAEKREVEELRTQIEARTAEVKQKEAQIKQKEIELSEREITCGNAQNLTSEAKEILAKNQAELTEKESQLHQQTEQLRFEQDIIKQQHAELTTRLELFNQQQLDYLARKQALTLQQFETDEKHAVQEAQSQHLTEALAAFETEKNAFKTEKAAFESQRQQFLDEKRRFEESNLAYGMSLKAKEDDLNRETARLQTLSNDLERRITEMNTRRIPGMPMQPFYTQAQTQMQSQASQPMPQSQAPMGTPEELYRHAERDGIRLNTRGSIGTQRTAIAGRENSTIGFFNKGATLFKSALLTLAFLLIECLIVFFIKDDLGISFIYPLVPALIGLVGFGICAILYANGYQANARLTKKSPSYIFSATVLFVVGVIIAAMVAVYCKAPLFEANNLLTYLIIPTVLLTNLIIFPVLYHFLSISKAQTQEEQ